MPDYLKFSFGDFIQTITVVVSILGLIIANRKNHNKLSVHQRVHPVLSQAYHKLNPLIPALDIRCDSHSLSTPYILEIDIAYTGESALITPCIYISCVEKLKLFRGTITNIPQGYEELWSVNKVDDFSYKLELVHINPNQALKVFFFIESAPTQNISVNCTMPNLEVYESGFANKMIKNDGLFWTRSNICLLIITGILGSTAHLWSEYVHYLSEIIGGCIGAKYSVPFVLSTFLVAIVLNAIGFPSMDAQWVINQKKRHLVMTIMALICVFSFYPLALVPPTVALIIIQCIAGCCVVVALAVFVRLTIIEIECKTLLY